MRHQQSRGLIALVVVVAVMVVGAYFMISREHGHNDAYSPPINAPVANPH